MERVSDHMVTGDAQDAPADMAALRAGLTPDAIAFIDHPTGRRYSFAEINTRADRLAVLLGKRGLGPGDRMAVLCQNHPDFFVLLFAAQKTGILLAPLNWRQPAAELLPVLRACGAGLLFHDAAMMSLASSLSAAAGCPLMQLGQDGDTPSALDALLAGAAGGPVAVPTREADGPACGRADAPWYLLYTSGTTGLPKAVIQTARMALANSVNFGRATGLTPGESSINYLPLFHTAGINLPALPVFLTGGTSTVLRKFDADTVLELIGAGRATCFFAVPAVYQALDLSDRVDQTDFSAVRSLCCGGAPVPAPLLDAFARRGVTICNGMGMTETGPTVFIMDRARAAEKPGSVGRPQPLTEVRLVGADGAVIKGAGEGELQFRGPNITPGYMDDPAATRAAFTPDGWLKSGDVGRRDADGYYTLVDRLKDMFISGGENVYPAEVERVLSGHPAIMEAVVVGVPDARWGEAGAAWLIARPGRAIDPSELDAWCRERLAAYKVPRSFRVVDDLPRTAAGKVRKALLKGEAPADREKETA